MTIRLEHSSQPHEFVCTLRQIWKINFGKQKSAMVNLQSFKAIIWLDKLVQICTYKWDQLVENNICDIKQPTLFNNWLALLKFFQCFLNLRSFTNLNIQTVHQIWLISLNFFPSNICQTCTSLLDLQMFLPYVILNKNKITKCQFFKLTLVKLVRANIQSLLDIKQKQNYQTWICQTHTCQHWVQMFHPYLILKMTKTKLSNTESRWDKIWYRSFKISFCLWKKRGNALNKNL